MEMIEWADAIFVMEAVHKKKLSKQFNGPLKGKKIIVLGIPRRIRLHPAERAPSSILEANVPSPSPEARK
ncbi:MAG: hypothetical protein MPW13_14785 [Candidatus Manganitrophus sp.]|nr:hypothetical protein [Candidatus Manganitrophus sp.]